jgi:hypothetical protein
MALPRHLRGAALVGAALATLLLGFGPAPTGAQEAEPAAEEPAAAPDEPAAPEDKSEETGAAEEPRAAQGEPASAADTGEESIAGEDESPGLDDEFIVVDEPEDAGEAEQAEENAGEQGAGLPGASSAPRLRAPPRLPMLKRPVRKSSKPAAPGSGARTARLPAAGATPSGGRAFGGVLVRDGAAGWQAEIFRDFPANWVLHNGKPRAEPLWELQHWCGGALIAHDWVLTAAHCITDELRQYIGDKRGTYRVRLGAEDVAHDKGITFRIDRAVVHPDFNQAEFNQHEDRPQYHDDIALVHIVADGAEPPRDPAQVREIPYHRGPAPVDGYPVTVTGWGKTEPVPGEKPSAVLLKVDLNVVSEPRCASRPGYGPQKVHSKVICAGARGHKTCRGDSGGPVVFSHGQPVVVGVVSWGKEHCGDDEDPGVYTRVAAYAPWIDKVIRGAAP